MWKCNNFRIRGLKSHQYRYISVDSYMLFSFHCKYENGNAIGYNFFTEENGPLHSTFSQKEIQMKS